MKYLKCMLIMFFIIVFLLSNVSYAIVNEIVNNINETENNNIVSDNTVEEKHIEEENDKNLETSEETNSYDTNNKTIEDILQIDEAIEDLSTMKSNAKSAERTKLYLDYPNTTNINQDTIKIDGWVMSTQENKEIVICIDGQIQQVAIETRKRPDVIKAIQGYGDEKQNPEPGFRATVNLDNIEDGTHKLEIKAMNKDTNLPMQIVEYNLEIKKYVSNLNIDYPNTVAINQDSLYIDGWIMSTCPDKRIEVYVDGTLRNETIETRKRPDVIKAIQGYGDEKQNPEPGFKTILNLKELSDGEHNLKIRIATKNNEDLAIYEKNFQLQKYQTCLNIDYPRTNNIKEDSLEINGWVMSTNADKKKIEIYINGQLRQEIVETRKRPDVINAIKGYGNEVQNPEPGFKSTLNLKNLRDNTYTLEVRVMTEKNKLLASETRSINIEKYPTCLNIDYPNTSDIRQDTMEINGWLMSKTANKNIEIYIDGTKRTEKIETRERPDVINAIQGYGTKTQNPKPGFKTILNLTGLSDGEHTLKIEVKSTENGETLASYKNDFILEKYPTTMYIDKPVNNVTTAKGQIELSGWVMSGYDNVDIDVYINGDPKPEQLKRRERPDVISAIKGYGTPEKNLKPGFSMTFNISDWKEGSYNIKVYAVTKDKQVLYTAETTFYINRKVLRGMDISEHNGIIDWEKVKDEIDFAIIRCGYGENNTAQDDKMYFRNIMECEKYNIPYGIYLYSYAINTDKARSEVEHVIRLLRNKNPKLGIWFDMEDADGYKQKYGVSDQMCRDITYTFCTTMKNRGYNNVGIYANLSWLNGKLDDSRLDQFPKWVAQWNSTCDYKKDYVMWQYTSSGRVNGISGNVDLDYYYCYR